MSALTDLLRQKWLWDAVVIGVLVCCLIFGLGRIFLNRPGARNRLRAAALRALRARKGDEVDRGRRQSNRRRDNLVEVLVIPAGQDNKPFSGYVSNRSRSGLGLIVPHCVAVGHSLRVRALNAPQDSPWVDVEVIHLSPLDRKHAYIGCQFLESPPWNVLLLFG
jgi:hypothetical protein